MRTSYYCWAVAAALILGAACDGDGTPTAPSLTSTFASVCSAAGPDGYQICIADLDPRPGAPGAPTQTGLIRARLTGVAPPELGGTICRPLLVWGDEDDPPELGWRGEAGARVSGRFDTWVEVPIEYVPSGARFRVSAALRSNNVSWNPQMRVLMYSPWVEGYMR